MKLMKLNNNEQSRYQKYKNVMLCNIYLTESDPHRITTDSVYDASKHPAESISKVKSGSSVLPI